MAYWYEYTDASGDLKIGICRDKATAKKWARICRGRYRGRWKIPGRRRR